MRACRGAVIIARLSARLWADMPIIQNSAAERMGAPSIRWYPPV